ncbi:RNA methylase family protein [Penicillium hispanicum]|uniref:RNA methylase family protein n=1 Tax=Penicillium hispanicum TaxID=1080232 RepID=UPI0025409FAB|nr:RNA methylase family protein [Penicillium hispanicum]KAJ5570159.1 RNA methylase family protein [Penicillium hispanicum]
MEYLIRLPQLHESFRQPELEAVATLVGTDLEIVSYDYYSPYCIVKLPDETAARALISRTILAKDIFELWGQGTSYEELHTDIHRRTQDRWASYHNASFAFVIESFAGKRSSAFKRDIIQSFHYMKLSGPVKLKNPDEQFAVMEEYVSDAESSKLGTEQLPEPRKIYMGRWIASSNREVIHKYDLKKRNYISTTSMEAELSLVTANMAHAAPGKLFFDPFVGTGSFLLAASHFGALTLGADIDPRSFRGKDGEYEKGEIAVMRNFKQYGTTSKFVDAFTSDLTNTPLRNSQFLDGIVCDPPYGVREGLRVLGTRDGTTKEPVFIDGVAAHYRPGYIAPKRPYGFEAMQRDVLDFAARSLVPNGRLAMWMPTASDEAVDFPVPMHPKLEPFHNWSRRLITYRRLPEGEISDVSQARSKADAEGTNADELNEFRRKYIVRNAPKREQSEKATQ